MRGNVGVPDPVGVIIKVSISVADRDASSVVAGDDVEFAAAVAL